MPQNVSGISGLCFLIVQLKSAKVILVDQPKCSYTLTSGHDFIELVPDLVSESHLGMSVFYYSFVHTRDSLFKAEQLEAVSSRLLRFERTQNFIPRGS